MNDPNAEIKLAIQLEEVVTFDYQKGNDPGLPRVFSPWEVQDDERVLGWDHDRSDVRSFKFQNFGSEVAAVANEEYARPA